VATASGVTTRVNTDLPTGQVVGSQRVLVSRPSTEALTEATFVCVVAYAGSGGGTGSAAAGGTDPKTAVYPQFTPAGVDDEFDDGSFSGWTLVDDGTHQATVTEANNVCSIALPGGDTSQHLHAWLKAATVSVGDVIEAVIRGVGPSANFHMCGLIMADGTTYGSGAQVCWALVPVSNTLQLFAHSNFNTQGTNTTVTLSGTTPNSDLFLRLKYVAANTFAGYVSADGVSWINLTGSLARTVTPSQVGFFATTFSATSPFNWSLRYFRKTT